MENVISKWQNMLSEERTLRNASRDDKLNRTAGSRDKDHEGSRRSMESGRGAKRGKLSGGGPQTDDRISRKGVIFKEDEVHSNQKSKSRIDNEKSNTGHGMLIDKIASTVLEIANKDMSEKEKLRFIKAVMMDLFGPTLEMIAELEKKLSDREPQFEQVSAQKSAKSTGPSFEKLMAAQHERVGELTRENALLEANLLTTQNSLKEAYQKLAEISQKSQAEPVCGTFL